MNRSRRCNLFHRITALILLVVLASSQAGYSARPASAGTPPPAPLPPLRPTQRDVTYCTAEGVDLKMDLYEPARLDDSPVPAAMFVHGGSWSSGDKASSEGALETAELVKRGYLVASINYRLAPTYVFPAQIEDVKCAVRYLRANSSTLNIDSNRIGAWGASAGAQLVSLLGTTDASADLEGDGGYPYESSRVQAVVDMYGRADLAEVPYTRPDLLPIFGGAFNLPRFSPVTYVSADDPPFLILHGDRDATVPVELSQEFYSRLQAAGVPSTLVIVENAGHGFEPAGGPISPTRTKITRMVGDFFDRYLKATPVPATEDLPPVRAQSLPSADQSVTFAPTGKTVGGIFLDYWKNHGGLAQQGYPISDELQEVSASGQAYTVQYFERAVLEYHPENRPPYNVLASRLGAQVYKAKYPEGAPGQHPDESAHSLFFEQTGHALGGPFLEYWQSRGGIMQQGYPISDEFTEISPLDGKPYTVQYFERAVFEYHPENDEANRVLLSQLGTLKYKYKYGSR